MPPFKNGFVKDNLTAEYGTKKKTELENNPIDKRKRKAKRKIRATEELYNIPNTSAEISEPHQRLTRSQVKTKQSFLPKIDDITDHEKKTDKKEVTLQTNKESKRKRLNYTENELIPKRQTRSSTRESFKISNHSKETDDAEETSSKYNGKERTFNRNVNKEEPTQISKKELIRKRKSSTLEIQQTEQKSVQNFLKNQQVVHTSYRKSLIKTPQNTAKNIKHSRKTEINDDDFVSKDSVHEILQCKSPRSLKKLHKDPRLTYDTDIKNSLAFIENRRETYDIKSSASIANFTNTETELNNGKENPVTNDVVTTSTKIEINDDDFVSKDSVYEILQCKSPTSLKKIHKDPRLTYNTDIKKSSAFIENQRETYDVVNSASIANFATTETELNNEKKNPVNNEVVTTSTKTFKADSQDGTSNDQILKNKDSEEGQEVNTGIIQETENILSKEKTEYDNLHEETDNGTNDTFTKVINSVISISSNLADKNIQHKEYETLKKIKDEKDLEDKNWENVNDFLNKSLSVENSTFTKLINSEDDITLKEINKIKESEIENEGKEKLKDTYCEYESLHVENNVTLKEINEKDKNLELKKNYEESKDITNLKELENTLLQDKEDMAKCTNSRNTFIKSPPQNNSNVTENATIEIQNLTYEKDEEAKEIEINTKIKAKNENNLVDIGKECNSPLIDEITLNNESNNTFATASDFDNSKSDSDNINVTIGIKQVKKHTEIIEDLFNTTSESKKYLAKGIIIKEQNNGNIPQNMITSTPSPLAQTENDTDLKTPSTKIINRRSTFEINESINYVTLLKTDEFSTPRETENIEKRKYGKSTPHPKKINTISISEDETNRITDGEIVEELCKTFTENETHSAEEIIANEQNNGDNPQSITVTSTPAENDNDLKTTSAKIINRRSTFEIDTSINHVNLLKTICDEFGTPRETENVNKRKYGESTPHPKKIEGTSSLDDETSIILINSPQSIFNDEKNDYKKRAKSDSDEEISYSIFEQKRISSINRLRKRRSKSLPIYDESLAEFLLTEKIIDDNYSKNITKRKKVTFKQIPGEFVAKSPIDSPIRVNKTQKKISSSLPSLVQKYSHPTSTSTPIRAASSLNKSKEPIKKITRTKLPNFVEIHKKMFNKMENIKEHSQRKAERTKLLLSGHKPIDNKKENGNSQKRENRNFSQQKENGNSSQKKEDRNSSQAKQNEKSRKYLNFYQKSKPFNDNINGRKFEQVQKNSSTFKNQNTNSTHVENQIKIQQDKPKNVTKFGFKIIDSSKIPTKEEQKKAVVGKTKIIKNTRDERRNLIQGVRSNRRFDLLMKMREKKN